MCVPEPVSVPESVREWSPEPAAPLTAVHGCPQCPDPRRRSCLPTTPPPQRRVEELGGRGPGASGHPGLLGWVAPVEGPRLLTRRPPSARRPPGPVRPPRPPPIPRGLSRVSWSGPRASLLPILSGKKSPCPMSQ